MKKTRFNKKVVGLSMVGILCLALAYFLSWWFILPVAIIIWINQREILKS